MDLTWALAVLSSFVQAVAMAFMVNAMGNLISVDINIMFWSGFIVPTYLVNKLFAGNGFKVWAIEVGDHLLNFVLFGAILGVWR